MKSEALVRALYAIIQFIMPQQTKQFKSVFFPWLNVALGLLLLAQLSHADNDKDQLSANLFEPPPEIKVLGPSQFPKPTHLIPGHNVTVIVKPAFGQHRADVDAVFAYAEGYPVAYYMMFIETLADTGFTGDYVLSVSEPSLIQDQVMEYLQQQTLINVVVYNHVLDCINPDGGNKRRLKNGSMDIFQFCQFSHVYGSYDKDGNLHQAKDPRDPRVVATLRYEWYWIWAQHYNPNVWILLIDARDTFFQSNPFEHVPRHPIDMKDGLLYFFGENHEATRLGLSTKNRNWLTNAYGLRVIDALRQKPTICSGSTMGEKLALEMYLRALVNEWDETDIAMTGADQGFHNYLYYSQKLVNAKAIRDIIVWEQGKGIVNNLGALRTKTLEEWGIYNKSNIVFQWDLRTPSPVVHQFDRDKALHDRMNRGNFPKWTKAWKDGSYHRNRPKLLPELEKYKAEQQQQKQSA